jgi:hypothetical protein
MHLHREKFLLFFFILFMICLQIVAAQDKTSGQFSVDESDLAAQKIENSLRADSLSRVSLNNAADKTRIISLKEEKNEFSGISRKTETKDFKYNFRTVKADERNFGSGNSASNDDSKKFPFEKQISSVDFGNEAKVENDTDPKNGFNWRAAINQSMMFLGVQHGFAILAQKKTRRALKGKFWQDYIDSVKSLHGWDDGGRFFTNYIAHPMQGSLTGFIYVQNSPQARRQQFGTSRNYWRSRMKAMLWSTAWSTQFEIGPLSQASIGNVGLYHKQTWEDIVVTPPLGTAMLIAEDAVDRFVIKNIERRTNNFFVKIFSRMIFNPTRIFANLLRFKEPWYRDRPTAH